MNDSEYTAAERDLIILKPVYIDTECKDDIIKL